jgi:hypothetical protein
MIQRARCPQCGTPYPSGNGGPRCLVCLAGALAPSAAPSDRLPPLAALQVRARLGEGGFGAVYLARDPGRRELVAVKVLRQDWANDSDLRERFRREFEYVQALDHKGIVRVHQYSDEGPAPWFSMKLLDGPSLAEIVAQRPPVSELVGLLIDVADALAYAYGQGVCHLDLKPSNILLDENGTPVVVDFGLALGAREKLPFLRGVVGGYTPGFTAPEFRGRFDPGASRPQADIYSFGAILYAGLTGKPPGEAEAAGSLRFPPSISRDLQAICRRCLAADPNDRYARMDIVRDDLRNFLEGRPVTARPRGTAGRFLYRVARNKLGSAAATLILLLAVALLGGAVYHVLQRIDEQQAAAQREAAEQARLAAERVAQVAEEADGAFRSGRWPKAAELYQQASDAGHPERARLETARLRCLFGMNRLNELADRLAQLEADPDLGERRGDLLLLRAELALLDPKQSAQGEAILRQALEARPSLSDADTAYARGLLADTAAETLGQFEQALALEPTHHRAQAALTAGLVLTGRLREGRVQAQFMHRLFPDDPFPLFMEGIADVLDGATADGLAKLNRVADTLGPRGARLREHAPAFAKALDAARRFNTSGGQVNLQALAAMNAGAKDLQSLVDRDVGPVGLPSPVVRLLVRPGQAYIQAATRFLVRGDIEGAQADVATALKRDPDAALALLAATIEWGRATKVYFQKPVDRQQVEASIKRVIELAELAVRTPTRFPALPSAYQARVFIAAALATLLREEEFPDADPSYPSRLREQLRHVIDDGAVFPEFRRDAVRMLLKTKVLDAAQTRVLLGDWGLSAAGDPEPWERLASLEIEAGNRPAAQAAADRAIAAAPADAALKSRLAKVLAPTTP